MMTAAIVACGFLLGSIPFAHLLSRRKGIDLRLVGSRNVGAANVLRTSGTGRAIAAMCLDAAKGCAAVGLARGFAPGADAAVMGGLASMLGHVYTPWLGFRGGKGVATGAGVFAILAPAALAVAAVVFVVTVAVTRFISAGSVVGSVALMVASVSFGDPVMVQVGAAVAMALIVFRHRGNLARLRAGTERALGVRS